MVFLGEFAGGFPDSLRAGQPRWGAYHKDNFVQVGGTWSAEQVAGSKAW